MAAWALKPNIGVKQEGTRASLVDPASGRSLELSADEAYVVGLMDGTSGPAQLAIATKAQGREVGPSVIAGLFERLTAAGFLEPKLPPGPAAPRAFNELPPLPPPPPSPGNLPPRARAAPLPPLGSPAAWASPGVTPAAEPGAPPGLPPRQAEPASATGKAPLSSPAAWASGLTAGLFLPPRPVTPPRAPAPAQSAAPVPIPPAAVAVAQAPAASAPPAPIPPVAGAPGVSGAFTEATPQAPDISGAFPRILLGIEATPEAPAASGASPWLSLETGAPAQAPVASGASPWISLETEATAQAPGASEEQPTSPSPTEATEKFEILAARAESFVGPAPVAPGAPATVPPFSPQRTASGSMPRITPQELNLAGAGKPPAPQAAAAPPPATLGTLEASPAAEAAESAPGDTGPAAIDAPAPEEADDAESTDRSPRRGPSARAPEEADDAEITDRMPRRGQAPPKRRGRLRWVVVALLLLGSAAAVTVPVQGEVRIPCLLHPRAETPVAAPRELVIKAVAAKNGQWVEKSTLLVTLEAPKAQDEFDRLGTEIASLETQLTTLQASVQRAKVDKAEATVSRAQHEVEVAQKALSRLEKSPKRAPARKLAKARAALAKSSRALEKAREALARASFKDQIAQAVATLAQKRGEQEAARIDIAEASVLSPSPGVVALGPKAVAGGKLAEAEVLATVRDSTTLIASANLSGADAALVREGQPVSIRVEGHAIKGPAHLGAADPATRTVSLEVELDNHERVFGPDQLCDALLPVAPLTPFEAAQRLVRNRLAEQ
ncbi:MAG: HlyD family secretion protein [Myxococcaceae bacterium]